MFDTEVTALSKSCFLPEISKLVFMKTLLCNVLVKLDTFLCINACDEIPLNNFTDFLDVQVKNQDFVQLVAFGISSIAVKAWFVSVATFGIMT